MPSYDKDNFITFNSNGTFIVDEGPTRGSPGDPQIVTGVWQFSANETKITYTATGSSQVTYDIVQLDPSTLKYTYLQTIAGSVYLRESTLGH